LSKLKGPADDHCYNGKQKFRWKTLCQRVTCLLQDFYAWLISFCSLSSSSILNCDSFSGYLYKNHDASVQNRRK